MISVAEARARILAPLRPEPGRDGGAGAGWGRVLAAPVTARLTQPPADVSAMDGYALRAADGVLGARLRVVGAAPAGHPFAGRVGRRGGAAVHRQRGAGWRRLHPAAGGRRRARATRHGAGGLHAGRHIRRAGQDFAAGDVLLQPGRRLGARDIGLAAAANHPWLAVHRRPRIAILATGDEIAMPGEPIVAGGIVSSNSHAMAALVRAGGGEPVVLPVARDDRAAIAAAVDGLGGVDMLVTTGGASVGEHDLVQSAWRQRGFELDFWKIAMRPGKPLIAGRVAGTPVLGLPGNPVSALICAALFLLPSLDVLGGPARRRAAHGAGGAGRAVAQNDGRADHLRATLATAPGGLLVATPFPRQDSGMLSLLARADALVLRAPHAAALPEGAEVEVIRLASLGL